LADEVPLLGCQYHGRNGNRRVYTVAGVSGGPLGDFNDRRATLANEDAPPVAHSVSVRLGLVRRGPWRMCPGRVRAERTGEKVTRSRCTASPVDSGDRHSARQAWSGNALRREPREEEMWRVGP
jgi:hypothetical protein